MSSGAARRTDAMMHALLIDYGFRRLDEGEDPRGEDRPEPSLSPGTADTSPSSGRRFYAHVRTTAVAAIHPVDHPRRPIAVTVFFDYPNRRWPPVDRPRELAELLEKGLPYAHRSR